MELVRGHGGLEWGEVTVAGRSPGSATAVRRYIVVTKNWSG